MDGVDNEGHDRVSELRSFTGEGNRLEQQRSSSSDGNDSGYLSGSARYSVDLRAPSIEEARSYFKGLPGTPRLIARSGLDPWLPRYAGTFPESKNVFNIGLHPILGDYDRGLRLMIRDALSDIEWYLIDIVRIGYASAAADNPVVVLITVQKDTHYVAAHEAVNLCRAILEK
jgi:hypothetical protein